MKKIIAILIAAVVLSACTVRVDNCPKTTVANSDN